MYNTLEQLAAAAADRPMHEVVIADEAALTDASPETIFETMRARWRVMCESASLALDAPQPMQPPLIAGQSRRQAVYAARAVRQRSERVDGAHLRRSDGGSLRRDSRCAPLCRAAHRRGRG